MLGEEPSWIALEGKTFFTYFFVGDVVFRRYSGDLLKYWENHDDSRQP